jgi:hypothetical protein
MLRILTLIALTSMTAGCVVKAAGSAAKAGADVAVGAAKTTGKAAGAAAGAVTTGHGDDHHDDDPRPFDEGRDAMADVDAAFAVAQASNKNVLLVLGGNWCHDSRGLAGKFERRELANVIKDGYELVWVDVGYRDRNLHVPMRFGVPELYGTPTVLILSPDGALLNRASVHDWKTADSKPYDETLDYFQRFAAGQ